MKGYNCCAWLKVGELEVCGKSCCQQYYKVHLARLRKGSRTPVRCRSCGKGVQSEIQLCQACGQENVQRRHAVLEKVAKNQFVLVLRQLLAVRASI